MKAKTRNALRKLRTKETVAKRREHKIERLTLKIDTYSVNKSYKKSKNYDT